MRERVTARVIDVQIDVLACEGAIRRLLTWARVRESRYVVACNAHVVATASMDEAYGRVINNADMATPDGSPVAWMMRRQGYFTQQRISGPDLMLALCEQCAAEGVSVFLYGGTDATLSALKERLRNRIPKLIVAGMESPPFRALSADEDAAVVWRINASGAGIVFVGLGCPKQERWMAEHRERVNAVMIGVGAAFDFHAGKVKRAGKWMQDHGLEWLHRLGAEPSRLWKRYLVTNTVFVIGALKQLMRSL